ncbi:MAG TPA: FAD-dependent oxidoreductase, partial [Thermoanaerobaculia bacterium]|nr:FAD-dependent oxidoreductase [Thermoanaerobaculia bacterium]
MISTADVVICGAGIAGISAAYHLAVRHGIKNVVLVDDQPPLTVTSDKSTECYRNWWPGPGDTMVRFMNRSIDLLEELAEESGNRFAMNRNGYVYLTAEPEKAAELKALGRAISELGAGELRVHDSTTGTAGGAYPETRFDTLDRGLGGADFLTGSAAIHERFPFVAEDALALLHPRRCGWLSAQQLGMYLLEKAREHGVRLLAGRLQEVIVEAGQVTGVRLAGVPETETIATRCFVNAAGPFAPEVGRKSGVALPLFNELHGKVTFDDYLGIVPRALPLLIWSDPVTLSWSDEERAELERDPELAWLLAPLPAGVHFRPEGGHGSRALLLLWTYHLEPVEPRFPPAFDPFYPEVVLRGLVRMVPGLAAYLRPNAIRR